MNAKIDIKHPSGRSLEGFPIEGKVEHTDFFLGEDGTAHYTDMQKEFKLEVKVFKGDTITIEIL